MTLKLENVYINMPAGVCRSIGCFIFTYGIHFYQTKQTCNWLRNLPRIVYNFVGCPFWRVYTFGIMLKCTGAVVQPLGIRERFS